MTNILTQIEITFIKQLLEYIKDHNIHLLDNFVLHNVKDGLIYTSEDFMKDYLFKYIDNKRVDYTEEDLISEIIKNPNRNINKKCKYSKWLIYSVFIYLIRFKNLNLNEYLEDYLQSIIEIEKLSLEEN